MKNGTINWHNKKNTSFKVEIAKRAYVYTIFVLVFSIISLASFSVDTYALWYETNNQPSDNFISTGCFNISFDDLDNENNSTSINLLNSYPISDATGVKLKPYRFTLKNICNIKGEFRITLSRLNNSNIDNSFLRYTFNRVGNALIVSPIPSESNTGLDKNVEMVINERNNPKQIVDNYILEEGYINPDEEITYEFRLWLNEDADNGQMDKMFEGVISISSIASN